MSQRTTARRVLRGRSCQLFRSVRSSWCSTLPCATIRGRLLSGRTRSSVGFLKMRSEELWNRSLTCVIRRFVIF